VAQGLGPEFKPQHAKINEVEKLKCWPGYWRHTAQQLPHYWKDRHLSSHFNLIQEPTLKQQADFGVTPSAYSTRFSLFPVDAQK
jgi:hypothetical protein